MQHDCGIYNWKQGEGANASKMWELAFGFMNINSCRQAASSTGGSQLGSSGEVILNWQENLDPPDAPLIAFDSQKAAT